MSTRNGLTDEERNVAAFPKRRGKRTAEEAEEKTSSVAADTARYEALAREHGADLSEEAFNDALKKVKAR